MCSSNLPTGWRAFERLQRSLDVRSINPVTSGSDEALSDLLNEFGKLDLPTDQQVERRFRSLRRNRVRKYRHRVSLLSAAGRRDSDFSPCKCIDDTDELCFARRQLTATEWRLVENVASGKSFHEIGQDNGLTSGQVRTRICRLRRRMRAA